jgi:hypothetical protein
MDHLAPSSIGRVFAVLAALTLVPLLTGCGRYAATAAPTATEMGATKLTWSERTIPPGLTLNSGENVVIAPIFSAADDQDGWLCVANSDDSFTIWGTTDQARSWRVVGRLTQDVTSSPQGCSLTPDTLDPRALTLSFGYGCGECGTAGSASYISFDGGATWRKLPGGIMTNTIVTYGRNTYLLGNLSASGNSGAKLYVTDSTLKSWRNVGPSTGPTGGAYYDLWPDPTTGALLISDQTNIWLSDPGVTYWKQIPMPAGSSVNNAVAGWVAKAHAWRICGRVGTMPIPAPNPTGAQAEVLQCTMDLGQTWVSASEFTQRLTCEACAQKTGSAIKVAENCIPTAMDSNGALYTQCSPGQTLTINQPVTGTLYRLAPGSIAWQKLSAPPDSEPNPFATPLQGTPLDQPSQDVSWLTFSGDNASGASSAHGPDVWYFRPYSGILAVAALPS